MAAPDSLASFLARHLAERPVRAWSFVVTVYGDAVAARGGSLWLGSLLPITAAAGIGDGVVRTALSRLAADGWIARTRIGRHGYHRLSARGRDEFLAATRRLYFEGYRPWAGTWRVVLLEDTERGRNGARGELERQGLAAFAGNVLLRPLAVGEAAPSPAAGVLLELTARGDDGDAARALAARLWPLAALAASYGDFIERFEPLARALEAGHGSDRLAALVVRILLIHDDRRIFLCDPLLPAELLPEGWPGIGARRLCARLYAALRAPAELWLDEHGRNETGPLPPPDASFARRFGDVSEPAAATEPGRRPAVPALQRKGDAR
ncbi:MAG TPA: PaaX family transcriptional regulator C-terminal domain-containing protein [Geminicoccaceae bacterium]|nr:PaaX family transcriptional regulator C-terminal domain-containing protein [Geminicoccaceae bacterium]